MKASNQCLAFFKSGFCFFGILAWAVFFSCPGVKKKNKREQPVFSNVKRWFKAIRLLDYALYENTEYGGNQKQVFLNRYKDHFYGDVEWLKLDDYNPEKPSFDFFENPYYKRHLVFKAKKVERQSYNVRATVKGNLTLVKYLGGPYKGKDWLVKEAQVVEVP